MKKTIRISGMHCAACAINIQEKISKLEGVKTSDVNFATSSGTFEYDKTKVNQKLLEEKIKKTGYQVVRKKQIDSSEEARIKSKKMFWGLVASAILTFPIFIRMFWTWNLPGEIGPLSTTEWFMMIASGIIVFGFGAKFHTGAWKQLKQFSSNMDTLISVGTLSALFYSVYAVFMGMHEYFETAATITTLILLGKYLEEKTKGKASEAMRKLMELGAKKARIITPNGIKEVDIKNVKKDDIFRVKPSEKIPLDGEIIKGYSEIDESLMTGESMPVSKDVGAKVFGGTINQNGILEVKVTETGDATVLGQIIKTVEQAQQYKAPIQKVADKVAGIFVPVVLSIALTTFIGWSFYSGDWGGALIKAVAVVIISCPCALGIATPIAIMVGSTQGSKKGVLIKSGESFEKAKDIDTIVFDKTGTLSKGKVAVDKVIWDDAISKDVQKSVFENIKKIESQSEHPLAKAISVKNQELKVENIKMKNFEEIKGHGLSGQINENQYLIGNKALMQENHIEIPEKMKAWKEKFEHQGKTVVIATKDKQVQCIIALSDQLKLTSTKTIAKAQELGLETVMITGDNKRTANAVAKELGIQKVHAEVMPNDKAGIIEELQKKGRKVAFAGDGINDAPALVQADLGVAMGKGTDIAKESGDIILVSDDPMKIVNSILLSKKTYKIIKQNLFWAFFYNSAAIPLAMFGIVNPMIASIAMALSDVTVIGNALRLKKA